MQKIMIVEDDEIISSTLKKHLEKWNYDVYVIEDFENIMDIFMKEQPALVLLDISLPYYNGYHWCQEIRKVSEVPIIFISSTNENMNIVMAMNMGGDDFLAKPIDLDVMMAKITAMLRRTYDMGNQLPMLEHRGLMLGLMDSTITYDGQKIELTKNEFRILQTLMERKGEIVSRDTLMMRLWQMDDYVEENTLTVNVNRLRKKLDSIGLHDYIVTKVGVGYLLPLE